MGALLLPILLWVSWAWTMASIFPPPSPIVPPFKTLLIHGPYHPSAPLHLCLSHNALKATNTALLIAPSRERLLTSLRQLGDEWLREHGGHGATSQSAMRTQILYPPSIQHLTLVLNSLHVSDAGGKSAYVPKTTLGTTPSVVVLTNLSSYVTGNPTSTVTSYLLLVTQLLASVASLSSNSGAVTSLAVFDSGLHNLRLPIVRPPSPTILVKVEGDADPTQARTESVVLLASRLFEWIGVIEAVELDKSDEGDIDEAPVRTCRLQLQQSQNHGQQILWQWLERRKSIGPGHHVSFEWL